MGCVVYKQKDGAKPHTNYNDQVLFSPLYKVIEID